MKRIFDGISAVCIGIINAVLGSGGGLIAVPYFARKNLDQTKAQANSVALILPLSMISALLYYCRGYLDTDLLLRFLPGGIIGAVVGSLTLQKIPKRTLSFLFSAFMLYSAARLLMGK